MTNLDAIDKKILDILQRYGKISNVELAKRVNLSATPCQERVKRLEREGFLIGVYAHLNPQKLNAGLQVFVEVSLEKTIPAVFEKFADSIKYLEEVLECHMVAGGFDYLLKIRTADMDEYRKFLGREITSIPGVIQTHTYFVMEEVKSTHLIRLRN
ncbi:MAG: Lrp/AsnC ligand binding domain-containing protein [Pseudomonadota bacterium]